jgi:ADP-ribosylglycohydrolase
MIKMLKFITKLLINYVEKGDVLEMPYLDMKKMENLLTKIGEYGAVLTEYGYETGQPELERLMDKILAEMKVKVMNDLSADEPNDYPAIRALCPGGNKPLPVPDLRERMAGAVLGRFAGCTLGVPVEMWSIADMKALAAYGNMAFPPMDYWTAVARPWDKQYGTDRRDCYTRDGMDGVPVDDDITYTILGLLIIERYGFHFTTEQVSEIWKEILPVACTAEDIALRNLRKGIPAAEAGSTDNPYLLWIGADIRADSFGYAAAGNPELAAKMGYYDAYLTHRRSGIYGEMFFAAVIAAAFTATEPIEAVRVGLKEIPQTCALYKDIEWALEIGPSLKDYAAARLAVDERFGGMSSVHTNNNACLVVFGLFLGKGDFTQTIANTIAMGLDNDCTGATAGSIMGAVAGQKGIAPHWTARFNDTVRTYITGYPSLSIKDVINRFVRLAEKSPG